ncbi:hypothetical protein C8J57DRAFT_1505340 [Mycena rebaudengoi]|nr:hypothetical protein C8J57DRAFT_1505340 [Mycena rebaudengoi]
MSIVTDSRLYTWLQRNTKLTLNELKIAAAADTNIGVTSSKRLRRLRNVGVPNYVVLEWKSSKPKTRDDLWDGVCAGREPSLAGPEGLETVGRLLDSDEADILCTLYDSSAGVISWYYEVWITGKTTAYKNELLSYIAGRPVFGKAVIVLGRPGTLSLDAADIDLEKLAKRLTSGKSGAMQLAFDSTINIPSHSVSLRPPLPEPYLMSLRSQGVTLFDAVQFLKQQPYGSPVKSVLRRMTARHLVLASVCDPGIFAHILRFVRKRGKRASAIPEPTDGDAHFGHLPVDVATLILSEYLDDVRQRLPFSQTLARNRALVALTFQQHIAVRLGKFNLDFYAVRLLFCATGALLSGSIIPSLIVTPSFDINDLDFFAPAGTGSLTTRFLRVAATMTSSRLREGYDGLAGITDIWELKGYSPSGQPRKINVIQAASESARNCVLLFHSTPVFGTLEGSGFWHGAPTLTFANKAVTMPSQLPLTKELWLYQRTWKVLLRDSYELPMHLQDHRG